MVYYFASSDGHVIYMGKDKYENEKLIKYFFPEDVWFHVDDLSSAHVYLRLQKEESWENIETKLLDECCQLVKENSIEGCKKDMVKIVYTPASNILKANDMEIGQVSFHETKKLKFVQNVKKDKLILKKIEKTKEEKYPDLEELKEFRLLEEKKEKFQTFKQQKKDDQLKAQQKKEEEERKSYTNFIKNENMTSNKDAGDDDDFM